MRELPPVQGKRPRPSFRRVGAIRKARSTARIHGPNSAPEGAGKDYAVCAARRSPLQSNTKAGGMLRGTNLRRTCEKRAFIIGRMMLEY